MPSKETDQLQDVQHRVQLARKLFAEQGEFIHSIVRFAAYNDEHTDDLVHDLFLFFVARPIPEDILNIRGYLYKVVTDKIRDWHRARIRYQTKIRQYGDIQAKHQAPPYQTKEQVDVQAVVSLIEKHLSKTEIRAIMLRYQKQYAIEEVAREMNIKTRSVSRYISVGLKKIRQLMKKQEGVRHEEGE